MAYTRYSVYAVARKNGCLCCVTACKWMICQQQIIYIAAQMLYSVKMFNMKIT